MGMAMEGVSSLASTTQLGSLWNAALGAVSGVVALVVQFVPSAQVPPGGQLSAPGVKEVDPARRQGRRSHAIKVLAENGGVQGDGRWGWRWRSPGVGVAVGVGGTGSTLSVRVSVSVPCAFVARRVMGNIPPVVGRPTMAANGALNPRPGAGLSTPKDVAPVAVNW